MKKKPIVMPKFVNEAQEADWWASREGREFVKRNAGGTAKKGGGPRGSRLVGQLNKVASVQIALRSRALATSGSGNMRDPIPATVSHFYGFFYLLPLGHIREAAEELERAIKEDPLNVLCRTQLAVCYWTAGRNEDASRQFRQALELDENYWLVLLLQGLWHVENGGPEKALEFAERAYSVAPKNPGSIGCLAGVLSCLGNEKRAAQLLWDLGDGSGIGTPLGFMIYHEIRLEFDQFANWAEKAIAQRDPNILPALCGPNRKFVVANGRWPALARMLNLPETASAPSA